MDSRRRSRPSAAKPRVALTAILKHAGAAAALEDAALNLSANLLGMGGAATPMGLRAVRHMAENGRASNGLYLPAAGVKSSRHVIPCVLLSWLAGCIASGLLIPPD